LLFTNLNFYLKVRIEENLTQVRGGTKKIIPILLICQKFCEQLLNKHAG